MMGVIFISIDDNELENLIQVCNDLYGETNKIGILKWKKKKQPSFASNHIATVIEYVLVYGKNKCIVSKFSIENISDATKKVINIYNPISTRIFKDGVIVKGIENGIIKAGKYLVKTMTVEYLSDINVLNGITTNKVEVKAKFLNTQENIDKFIENKLLFITEKKGLRRYVSEEEKSNEKLIVDLLLDWGDNQESEKEQKSIFGTTYFDYAKPSLLLHNIINSITQPNDIILDFFSGSATTAHAVMKLNAEDQGNRKFILVQLPEATDENSEAYKAGYKTICDIGEERIRRAGKKIKEENPLITKDLDIGFRVYRVDDSNMKDIYYTPDKIDQKNILDMVSNVKEDRNALDLLTQVMLNLGIPLDLHIEEKKIGKNNVFFVENNSLVACFDDKVDIGILDEISKVSPLKVCLRESSFNKDQDKINFFERLKKLSPDTEATII